MAIDYETLVGDKDEDGSIRNWMNHSGVPASTILTMSEQDIYRDLRVRQMLQTATGTLSQDAGTITLPTNYKQLYFFMFTGANKSIPTKKLLDEVTAHWNYDSSGNRTTGTPRLFAADGSTIVFDTQAYTDLTYMFRYYGSLTALSNSNPTNFLTDEYPHLLYCACMTKGNEWTKNEREKAYWLRLYQDEVYRANKETDQEMAGVEMDMVVNGGDEAVLGVFT
jgi:hypothetical protein